MNIVFFGPPCSGKGTQAVKVSQLFGFSVVDAGFLLRTSRFYGSIKNDINKGKLLDDEMVIKVVSEALLSVSSNGFILDGYPRSLNQVLAMNDFHKNYGIHIDLIVCFEIEESKILARALSRKICGNCGALIMPNLSVCDICTSCDLIKRADDNDASIVKYRISQYYQNKNDIMENIVHNTVTVNAGGSVESVFKEICVSLDKINS